MKNKGFTLIELLAVIVILGIIMLIATPIILNVIDDSKKKAFEISANNIVRSAELEYWNNTLGGPPKSLEYRYENGQPIEKELEFKGQNPKKGTILVNVSGNVAMAIYDGTWCAIKDYYDEEVLIEKLSEEECVLSTIEYIDVKAGQYEYYNEANDNWDILTQEIALSKEGDVYVRGEGYIGLSENMSNTEEFTKIAELSNIQDIYINQGLLFALSNTGDLYWWGIHPFTDDDGDVKIYYPTIIESNVKTLYIPVNLSSYYIHTNDKTIKLLGFNESYSGLTSDENFYVTPVLIPGLENVKELILPQTDSGSWVAGKYALLADGTVKVWGRNLAGAAADGTSEGYPYAYTPKLIPNLTNVSKLYSNGSNVFAIISDGTVKAWGVNYNSVLGLEHSNFQQLPAISNINDSQNIKDIQFDRDLIVILKNNGQVFALGKNVDYLGLDSFPNKLTTPTLLPANNIGFIFLESQDYSIFSRLILVDKEGFMYYSGLKYIDFDNLYINFNLPNEFQEYESLATCIEENINELVALEHSDKFREHHCFNDYDEDANDIFYNIIGYSDHNIEPISNSIKKFNKFSGITKFKDNVGISNGKIFKFITYPTWAM